MSIQAEFKQLSIAMKIQVVQELWDQISVSPDHLLVPDWHCTELKKRQDHWASTPDQGEDWDVVKKRLREAL